MSQEVLVGYQGDSREFQGVPEGVRDIVGISEVLQGTPCGFKGLPRCIRGFQGRIRGFQEASGVSGRDGNTHLE